MPKDNIKLSNIQKEVIRKMREGYILRWEGKPKLIHNKTGAYLELTVTTARFLYAHELVFQGSSDYYLTNLGKSIEL